MTVHSPQPDNEQRLQDLYARAADQPSAERVEEVWGVVASELGIAPRAGSPLRLMPRRRTHMRHAIPWLVAASAVAAVVLSRHPSSPPASPHPAWREYATTNAQRADVRLSDGSRVVLAPASRLVVPDSYGVAERVVRL